MCVDGFRIRAKEGGAHTGLSPIGRGEDGQQRHLICDGHSTPLKVITTAANQRRLPAPNWSSASRPSLAAPNIAGLGKFRYALVSLACSLICWRRLKKTRT